MSVCKQWDSYMQRRFRDNAIWTAYLSNGETIFSDDNRPDVQPASSWLRLVNYCNENDLHITKIGFKFSSQEHVPFENPEGLEGVLFSRGAGVDLFSGQTFDKFIWGLVDGDQVRCTKYTVPDCQFESDNEIRELTESNIEFVVFKDKSRIDSRKNGSEQV